MYRYFMVMVLFRNILRFWGFFVEDVSCFIALNFSDPKIDFLTYLSAHIADLNLKKKKKKTYKKFKHMDMNFFSFQNLSKSMGTHCGYFCSLKTRLNPWFSPLKLSFLLSHHLCNFDNWFQQTSVPKGLILLSDANFMKHYSHRVIPNISSFFSIF